MADGTNFIAKDGKPLTESALWGVSIRGWIAWWTVFTICANQLLQTSCAVWLCILQKDISFLGSASSVTEPLYGVVYMAVGFYFGKMTMPKQGT